MKKMTRKRWMRMLACMERDRVEVEGESGEEEKRRRTKGIFFSASSSKYECYEINERSFFTGCLICFRALKSGTVLYSRYVM
jgi:hypothetical protein